MTAWNAFKRNAGAPGPARDRALMNQLRTQINCLRYRAGVKFGLLPRFSQAKQKLPLAVVQAQYEILLDKIDRKVLKPAPKVRGIEERLIKKVTAFRNGTLVAGHAQLVARKRAEYQAQIVKLKAKLAAKLERAKAKKQQAKKKNRRKYVRLHPDFTGRRIVVPSEYFGVSEEIYVGTVHKWCQYDSASGVKLWGYDVHYDLGDKYTAHLPTRLGRW